jgi:hypothetical protein
MEIPQYAQTIFLRPIEMTAFKITGRWVPQRRGPSLPGMATNAFRAVVRNAKSVARGNPVKVSPEVEAMRRVICIGCTEFHEPEKDRCLHPKCGCYLRVKRWAFAEPCPAGKWSA